MRKYDSKNKKNIGIIVGICIVFAIIFSYFLVKEIKLSQIKYELEESTLVFDIDKNNILLNEIGTIKKKWNNKYYLTYKEEQYQIGTHVIAFNNNELSLSLYGEFYEVNRNSEINITKEETKLNNLGISRFYKIADRKYLIVDSSIKSEDSSLETSNYLIVELDKLGNAILYNNNLNLKTFSETKLVTSNYTFDIANELLIYEDKTVDLKKILGTTNEYKEPEENDGTSGNDNGGTGNAGGAPGNGNDGTGNAGGAPGNGNGGTGNAGGAPGNGNGGTGNAGGAPVNGNGGTGNAGGAPGNGNGGTGNDDEIITDEDGTDISDSEIINQTATTSIIKINPLVNSISVDYVIYDTQGKYLNTFVEVKHNNNVNIVHLSKSNTNISLTNLIPGTDYTLTFKYSHLDNEILKEEIIDVYEVTTLLPNITLVGTKVTSKKIDYDITIDSYSITSARLRIYVDGVLQNNELLINDNNLKGSFNISNITLSNNSLVELSLEDIYVNGIKVDKKIKWSYKRNLSNNIQAPSTEPGEGEDNEE